MADKQQARIDAWFSLVMEIGKRVGCWASSFPDGNAHILRAIDRLAAPPATVDPAGAAARIADLETQLASEQSAIRAARREMRLMDDRLLAKSREIESLHAQAADVAGERVANAVLTNRVERLEAAIAQGERS